MQYRLVGTTVPAVEMRLNKGESLYTQSGGMTWQTNGVRMETNTNGGLMKGIGRMFAGESLFMCTYTAEVDGAQIAFAATVPGVVHPVDVSTLAGLTIQKGSFLCAQPSVQLKVVFTKKISAGFFGGEGFILQQLNGSGMAFLEVDGDLIERTLGPGEVLKVDTGNVVGFESTVKYEVETIKGLGNIFFGGEGLFLTKLTGPGKILLQTMNMGEFAGRLRSYFPSK